jgi:trigger factor
MSQKNYTNIKLNHLPEREIEIIGTITAEKMESSRTDALKKIASSLEIDGFRKGNAPMSVVAKKVGEIKILEEAAEVALNDEYPKILEEHNIDAIGRPEITITKIAPLNPLEFKIKTALMPEVKLPDYKKISKIELSKKRDELEVSPKEVEDMILNIRKNIYHQTLHQNEGLEEHDHNHGEIKEEDLPEMNSDFLKMIGNFKDTEDLRIKVKESLLQEKELKEKDKRRISLLEEIITSGTIEIPKIIVEGELDKMTAQFKDDFARSNIPLEDYLKQINKTEKDLRDEWKETAVKRAKSQIILNTIAKEENIKPNEEEVKKEMEHILSHHKDADRFRVRMYVETFMTNELVFKFLEEEK